MINIQLDQSQVEAVITALRKVEGASEEAIFKKAVNETAKKAQKELAKKARSVYSGEAPRGILSRSRIDKATTGSLSATIHFKSDQPDITKFKYSPKSTPTKFLKSGKTEVRNFPFGYRTVHRQKKYNVRASQLKGGGGTLPGAFVVQFKSGHVAVAFRPGSGRKVKTVMGSSDRSMVRNEKVYGELQPQIAAYLNTQVQTALAKALGR